MRSGTWTPNFEGEVLGVGGHAHDGGDRVHVQVNEQLNCDSFAKYAETPEFQFKPAMKMGGAAMGVATDHISSMKTCFFEENKIRKLDPSQKWRIQALYDYDKYPGNKNEAGKQEGIMAIAIMYVAIKPGTTLTESATPAAAAPAAPAAASAAKGLSLPKGLPKQSTAAPPMPGMPGMAAPKVNMVVNEEAYWE